MDRDAKLPPQDSNLDHRLQRPVCCHYTRGQEKAPFMPLAASFKLGPAGSRFKGEKNPTGGGG